MRSVALEMKLVTVERSGRLLLFVLSGFDAVIGGGVGGCSGVPLLEERRRLWRHL